MFRIIPLFAMLVCAPQWSGRADRLHIADLAVMQGIDVSHHQKQIAWDAVAAQKAVDFAFVKATEGQDWVDTLFCHNWSELKRFGIRRGAYHFFRAYGCGDEQAAHFLSMVELEPGDLIPVLDLETLDGVSSEVLVQEALIWLQTVENKLGVKPIVYSNLHFYERHLAGFFDAYPLWIARYAKERPQLSTGKNWDFWQFTNEGSINGIAKQVDMNIFPGTPEMLEQYCWRPVEPAPVMQSLP